MQIKNRSVKAAFLVFEFSPNSNRWIMGNRWIMFQSCIKPQLRIFSISFSLFFFLNSHSQIRITIQSLERNRFVMVSSCFLLHSIFVCQYEELSDGLKLRQLCPCQKQPSTKTAIFSFKNTKSGCPITL